MILSMQKIHQAKNAGSANSAGSAIISGTQSMKKSQAQASELCPLFNHCFAQICHMDVTCFEDLAPFPEYFLDNTKVLSLGGWPFRLAVLYADFLFQIGNSEIEECNALFRYLSMLFNCIQENEDDSPLYRSCSQLSKEEVDFSSTINLGNLPDHLHRGQALELLRFEMYTAFILY